MSTTNKARKATITYNGIELEVYQLPDGSYHLSKTQVGKAIEKYHKSVGEWLEGNSPEALPHKGYSFGEISVIGETNGSVIHSVPLEIAAAYWTYWAQRGNTTALALVSTSVVECITRLCNSEFGVKIEESQIQQMNVDNMETNKMLFSLMSMMENMQKDLKETQTTLNSALDEMHEVKEEKKKLEEFKDDVENYVEFSRLLDVAKNEVDENDYPDGINCQQYITINGIPLHENALCTLSRRTASYYRSTKGINPPKHYGKNIYRGKDVAYIITTIQMLMRGL